MNSAAAYAALRRLGAPVVQTSDAAAALGQSTSAAAKTLSRLAQAGLIAPVRHGIWWVEGPVDPYRLPQYLTTPFESYLSLQTALSLRGLIEQIPEVFYAVTLARTQRTTTSVGTLSFHHLSPDVFGGYEENAKGVRMASAEKALFDYGYLSAGKSRLFTALPELELPRNFRHARLEQWLVKIPSARSRTITERKLQQLIASARRHQVSASS